MRNVNCNVLSAVDTGSASGSQIDANQLINASFHAYFGDATAAGTVKLQASNDINNDRYQASDFVVTNWADIPARSDCVVTATVASGAPALLSLSNMAYRWVRVVFTYASGGSSTINVNMDAVGV